MPDGSLRSSDDAGRGQTWLSVGLFRGSLTSTLFREIKARLSSLDYVARRHSPLLGKTTLARRLVLAAFIEVSGLAADLFANLVSKATHPRQPPAFDISCRCNRQNKPRKAFEVSSVTGI